MSQQINLFNPVFLKRQTLFSALAMAQAVGLIALGLGALTLFSANQVRRVREDAAIAASRVNTAQTQLTQMMERVRPTQKDKNLEEAIKLAESRFQASQQILAFVSKGELGNTQGYSEFFRAFSRRSISGVWLTGVTITDGGSGIEIRGRALLPTLLPQYLAMLRQETLFRGKSFDSLELRTPITDTVAIGAAPALQATSEAAYIEFTLKSPGAVNERPDQNEGRAK